MRGSAAAEDASVVVSARRDEEMKEEKVLVMRGDILAGRFGVCSSCWGALWMYM